MPQSQITTWLDFALQQMAAESYLDDPGGLLTQLSRGNNKFGFDPPTGPLLGVSRFTNVLADRFISKYDIISHHANDATGFSATLINELGTNNFTLSFRSTEYGNSEQGGDFARDGLLGADGEILSDGFALGQLAAMENYYRELKSRGELPAGSTLNVTGFSLGGHLATIFTELHSSDADIVFGHTYTFNGAGRGHITGEGTTEADRIWQMIQLFTNIVQNPERALPYTTTDDPAYLAASAAGAGWNPFAQGSPENAYLDPRYVLAKQIVLGRYDTTGLVLSPPPGEVGTSEAFQEITQLFGHATHNDTEYVANRGVHGAATSIFIEDQPDLDGFGGFFGSTGDYGTTHSITLIVDSLAVMDLFQMVGPALRKAEIESILWASSNQRGSGFVGTTGIAEGNALESALDALGILFVPNYTTTQSGRQTGDFGSLTFRNPFYANVTAIQTALAGATVSIEPFVEMGVVNGQPKALPRLTLNDVISESQQDTDRGLAFRYALKNLNPFAVIGADYNGLGHASNGALALFDLATGFGELTLEYLADRAALLEAKIELNLVNNQTSGDTIYYKDFAGAGYEIPTGSIFATDQRFLFGSDADDPPLVGNSAEDHLYGGAGNDLIDGQGERDYLEGNAGNDVILGGSGNDALFGQQDNDLLDGGADDDRLTGGFGTDNLQGGHGRDIYYYRSGDGADTITDSDGAGTIEVDQRQLQGGVRKLGDPVNMYTSLDGQFRYILAGSTLAISDLQKAGTNLTVQNFSNGQLSIRLVEVPAEPQYDNGLSTHTNDDFTQNVNGVVRPAFDEANNTVIMEGPANNVVQGFGGNDTIISDFGNDIISGDAGDDSILGAGGHDRLFGGIGNDTLSGGESGSDSGQDYLDGGDGNDLLFGGDGHDWLIGGDGDDWLEGDDQTPFIAGIDFLEGGAGQDVLLAGRGNDILDGGTGTDLLIGGAGDDVLYGGNGVFHDELQGDDGSDVLMGGDGDDSLFADGANRAEPYDPSTDGTDYLDGGFGDDFLFGGGGADILIGGIGADWLAGDYTNLLIDFGADDLLDGGEGEDLLEGGGGNDTLYAGSGDDTLYGDANPNNLNVIATTGGDDFLDGADGNDTLHGGRGRDLLLGGLGDDALFGDEGNDTLAGGDGNDTLNGGSGSDVAHGGSGNDRLFAAPRAVSGGGGEEGGAMAFFSPTQDMDTLFGDAGNDYLSSGNETFDTEDSVLVGGIGDDTYVIDSVLDKVVEEAEAGVDAVQTFISYTLPDHVENLTVTAPSVVATGNALDNVLRGTPDSILDGRGGNDTLIGGRQYVFSVGYGHDTVLGGGQSVQFNADVLPSEIQWQRRGNDLLIRINGTTDELSIPSFYTIAFSSGDYLFSPNIYLPGPTVTSGGSPYYTGPAQVTRFEFADGAVWGVDQFDATMIGDHHSNTYTFGRGDGVDTILDFDFTSEQPVDVLQMKPGVVPGDMVASRAGDNLLLSIAETSDQLTVQSYFAPILVRWKFSSFSTALDAYRIEEVRFTDGTVWDSAAIANELTDLVGTATADILRGNARVNTIQGLEGNDWLESFGGDDLLDGGAGNDSLLGGKGSDTYLFGRGSGADLAEDFDVSGSDLNTIQLSATVVPTDIVLQANANGDLVLRINGTSDQLTLEFFLDDPSARAYRLEFSDGTTWDTAAIMSHAVGIARMGTVRNDNLSGTPLNDTLFGLQGNDTLWGDAGADLLNGGSGNDTYYFELGNGVETIDDIALPGEGNQIEFAPGISLADLRATQGENVLTISVGSSGDALRLLNFDTTGTNGSLVVETLAFSDGSVANLIDLLAVPVNNAPTVAIPLADQTVPEDILFTFVVPAGTFADGDAGETLTLSASSADGTAVPSWLSFNPISRTFTGMPDDAQVGSLDLRVTVTDTGNLSVSDIFRITIVDVNESPSLVTPLADQQAAEDAPFSLLLPAGAFADVDPGDTLTYSATLAGGDPPPAWLTFNPETRTFSGTPGAGNAGNFLITVAATDTGMLSVADTFALAVSGPLPQTLTGTAGSDVLIGGRGDDILSGLGGNDVFTGGQGHDLLDGGAGNDAMTGGAGNDTYIVDAAGDIVTELANEGTDTVQSSVAHTLGNNVENLTLIGAAAVNGTGNALNNVLIGNSANNILSGGAGNDRLDGGLGNDTMVGGTGDDAYVVNQAGDIVTESINQGTDTVESNITFILGSNVENLILTGTGNINGTGSSANNTLTGNSGNNTLDGGSGNDMIDGGAGNDSLLGGSGDDTMHGGLGDDTLIAGSGNDVLKGGEGADVLDGGSGNDQLFGGLGNDLLTGGSGADQFTGGIGNDMMTGGSGNDLYLFSRGDGQDTISDSDSFAGNQDRALFGVTINPLDLVLSRQVNDLRVAVHGSADHVTVQNWYLGTSNRIETFQAGDGQRLLSSRIDQLIQGMASFSRQTGLTWDQAIDQRQQEVQAVLAAAWQ